MRKGLQEKLQVWAEKGREWGEENVNVKVPEVRPGL